MTPDNILTIALNEFEAPKKDLEFARKLISSQHALEKRLARAEKDFEKMDEWLDYLKGKEKQLNAARNNFALHGQKNYFSTFEESEGPTFGQHFKKLIVEIIKDPQYCAACFVGIVVSYITWFGVITGFTHTAMFWLPFFLTLGSVFILMVICAYDDLVRNLRLYYKKDEE